MSFYISKQSIEQLEFDKIQQLVGTYSKSEIGRARLLGDPFEQDIDSLNTLLDISIDVSSMIGEGDHFQLFEYNDLGNDLFLLSKNGYVLDAESVLRIAAILRNYNAFVQHFDVKRKKLYPHLFYLGFIEEYTNVPLKLIDKVFDPKGNVRRDASPELTRIFRRMDGVAKQLDKEFLGILKKHREANQLTDTAESIRNGRRVLVLPVENKRKISGVIHDHSASGKTVYIEPQEVMVLNNELYELENDKRTELYKILKTLSEELRSYKYLFENVFERICDIDVALAKGAFSHKINGRKPQLINAPILEMRNVYHPLLVWQGLQSGNETIAFDIHLKGDNKLLLISGPNAGGKSVTLKAIGLIHLMIYHGLLVPIHEESKIGMLGSIYTDIGDQQSIDEGLSTYSSHLTNLKKILEKSNRKSLVLLDEIGSGTDPKLGGAIAEGILNSLIYKGVYGVVTTHYSQLKAYAFDKKGIVNGAMLFDKERLTPTYRLKVGKPGSSYAFEVANKVGLSHHVLKYARKKVGKKENLIEDLLVDLQEGKAILDEQLDYIADEKKKLDRLIKNYHEMTKQYDVKRKKLKIKDKELDLRRSNDEQVELQKLINKLEKEKNLDKARELKEKVRSKRREESTDIIILKKDILQKKDPNEEIFVGDNIKMLDGNMIGEVLRINGDRVTALFGLIQMEVGLADVVLAADQLSINRTKHINFKAASSQNTFTPKLDIRGYTKRDAEETLEAFFDRALLNNARTLEILHGKGTGVLRKMVIKKMREYDDFQSYHHPEHGGDGVTIIKV